jgi:hypothetical protein
MLTLGYPPLDFDRLAKGFSRFMKNIKLINVEFSPDRPGRIGMWAGRSSQTTKTARRTSLPALPGSEAATAASFLTSASLVSRKVSVRPRLAKVSRIPTRNNLARAFPLPGS